MITELILQPVQNLLIFVISLVPDLDIITIPVGLLSWFTNVVGGISYFLPMTDLLAIFGLWLLTKNFHIIWKIIQRLWDAIPLT